MSRRHSSRAADISDDSIDAKIGRLLYDVRAEMGFLIWDEEEAELRSNPPTDVELLADAVIAAGGYDPTHVSGDTRKAVLALIRTRMC